MAPESRGAGRTCRRSLPDAGDSSVRTRAGARSRADILRFFDGFDLVDPGLVYVSQWRPGSSGDVPSDPGQFWGLVGIARKP